MKDQSTRGDNSQYYKNFFWDVVVVFSLFALGVTRPLFEVLAPNVVFFVYKRASSLEIIIFVLVISLVVPFTLVLFRYFLSKISQTAAIFFQGILVGLLSLACILPILNRTHSITNDGLMLLVVLVCGLLAAGYFFLSWLRLFYRYLAPAIVIVPLLFLFSPGIYRILTSKPIESSSLKIQSDVPLVIVVFDEFPLISLLNENREIDSVRYPNFSRLAKEWTWYRNANSVASQTEDSIPAILTGMLPKSEQLPTFPDHPQNLFSLLQKSHQLEIFESLTSLNPKDYASNNKGLIKAWRSVVSDLWLVYLHIILPEKYLQNLPPIAQSWGDFAANNVKISANRKANYNEPTVLLTKFLDVIQPSEKPPLYFLHVKLPHAPWHLLPSGKDYGSRTFEGIIPQLWKWRNNEPIVQRAYQRHLLQVGFVDHWIGELIHRLKAVGIYDKSVIVVAADHGISFTKSADLRVLSNENADEIIFVPLFIKAPGQNKGQVNDWNVNTTDIFPTVADLMGFKIPWNVDGISLKNHPPVERPRFVCDKQCEHRYHFDPKFSADGSALKRKLQWFGSGSWDRLFSFGPCSEMIGKPAPRFPKPAQNMSIKLQNKESFSNVSLNSDLIPAFVTGELKSNISMPQQAAIGVSINGVFEATAYSLVLGPKIHNVDILLPESSIQAGNNQIQMYVFSKCSDPMLLEEQSQP